MIEGIARAIAVLAVMLLASSCSQSSEPLTFKVKQEGNFVPGVNRVVELGVDIDATDRDGRIVDAAGRAVVQVAREMTEGRPPVTAPFDHLIFNVRAPQVKPSDDAVGPKIMHITFDADELRRAYHAGADADTLLSLASDLGWWTPANDDVIAAYCVRPGAFCTRFATP